MIEGLPLCDANNTLIQDFAILVKLSIDHNILIDAFNLASCNMLG